AARLKGTFGMRAGFLQGHIGDVNPGDGTPWRGDLEETANAVSAALYHATTHGSLLDVNTLRIEQGEVTLPFDFARFDRELETYRAMPEACTQGTWVDADFAKARYDAVKNWDRSKTALRLPVAVVQLGELALLFHPAELY